MSSSSSLTLNERVMMNLPKGLKSSLKEKLSEEISDLLLEHLKKDELNLYIESSYPRLDDTNFLDKMNKLSNVLLKVDDILADYSSSPEGIRSKIEREELFYFQRFITKYINRNSPYRGVLLFYGLGAGKTRTSIAATNSFIEEGKEILVLTPASLEENFKKEYLGYIPPVLRESPKTIEYFKFLHYNAPNFAKSKEDDEDQLFDKISLDNKVIIIDEMHNFVSLIVNAIRSKRPRGIRIYNKIMNAKNIRIIALSGTPVINFPFEAAILINILVGYLNSRNEPWTERDGSDKYPMFKEDEDEFNKTYLDSNPNSREYSIKKTAESAFCRRIMGNVSYYGGLTGGGIYPDLTENLVKIDMSDHQFQVYLEQRAIELSEISDKVKKQIYSTSSKTKELNMDIVEKKSSFRSATREICNFAFPLEIPRPWRKDISSKYLGKAKKEKKYVEKLEIENILATEDEKEKDDDYVEEDFEGKSDLIRELQSATTYTKRKAIIDKIYHLELEMKLDELNETKDIYLNSDIEDKSLLDYCYLEETLPGKYDIEKKPYLTFKTKQDTSRPSLLHFSPKMLSILYNIEKARHEDFEFKSAANSLGIDPLKVHSKDGSIVIYSYFNRVEGINIMQKVLDVAGYQAYKLSMGRRLAPKKIKGRYCFWEGADRDKILEVFNSPQNKYGDIIKILLITEAGAEGITLKNVRQMHIMEPYWNEVQTRQVIGRAKRMYSHKALEKPVLIPDPNPSDKSIWVYLNKIETSSDGLTRYSINKDTFDLSFDIDLSEENNEEYISDKSNLEKVACIIDPYRTGEQHVNVFRYKMKFSEKQIPIVEKEFRGEVDELLTTDEVLGLIALRKKAVTDQVELFMKQTSADCIRNKSDNDKLEAYSGNPPINCYVVKGIASEKAFAVSEENVSKTSRIDIQKTVKVVTSVFDVRIINNGIPDKLKYVFKRDVRKQEKSPAELPCIYIYSDEVKSSGLSDVKPLGLLIKVGQLEEAGKTVEIYKGRRISSSKDIEKAPEGHIKYRLKTERDQYILESL